MINLNLKLSRRRFNWFASVLIAFGVAAPAYSLTIVPTFDASITNDPNGAAMQAAIHAAIQALQTNLADNFTVYIHYTNDPTAGLGENETWGNNYPYSDYLAALKRIASDSNDTNAISQLPNSPADPVIGGTSVYLTLPLARHLGLDSGEGPDGFDSTIYLNMSIMNLSRPPADPNKYDLITTTEHEINEVLGTSSGLPDNSVVWAVDLFRYNTNLVRSFTISGDDAYFSVDGTNLLARFNTNPEGDYGDFWSDNDQFWAPPGVPPHEQVQDAFLYPATTLNLGPNELAMLDVIGWTLALPTAPGAPTLSVLAGGGGRISISWSSGFDGYLLQETTNLMSGLWTASATGTTNPAVINLAGRQKFYRLFNLHPILVSDLVRENAGGAQSKRTSPLRRVTHVFRPGQR